MCLDIYAKFRGEGGGGGQIVPDETALKKPS